jgi:hypothetical protein
MTEIDPGVLLIRTRTEAAIAKRRGAQLRRKLRVAAPDSEERIVRRYQRDTRALEAFKRFFGSRQGARFVKPGITIRLPSGKEIQPFKDIDGGGGGGGERRPRKGR